MQIVHIIIHPVYGKGTLVGLTVEMWCNRVFCACCNRVFCACCNRVFCAWCSRVFLRIFIFYVQPVFKVLYVKLRIVK